jgi:hypothetical protein
MIASVIKRKMTRLLKRQHVVTQLLHVLQNRPETNNPQTIINRGRLAGKLIAEYFKIDREMGLLRVQLMNASNKRH